MDLLRPRFIVSDNDAESCPPSVDPISRRALTRRRSADPDMMPRILVEESPSRSSSRRGSITTTSPISPKLLSSKPLTPRSTLPVAPETKPAPAESGILRSIFDAITTTEMAYIALQRRQGMEAKSDDEESPRSARHRVMQSIRDIGSKMTLTPEQHFTEQIASMRREMTKLRGDHERQMEQIRRERDQLERQRSKAQDLVMHLRQDLERTAEKEFDQDFLKHLVTKAKDIETMLATNRDDATGEFNKKWK